MFRRESLDRMSIANGPGVDCAAKESCAARQEHRVPGQGWPSLVLSWPGKKEHKLFRQSLHNRHHRIHLIALVVAMDGHGLDLEADAAVDEHIQDQYDAESRDHDARLVVLGRTSRFKRTLPEDRIVSKPYHYAPLIRKIEELLGSRA